MQETETVSAVGSGSIPVITVEADTLAEAWEKSLLLTWERGCAVSTTTNPAIRLPATAPW
jgi:hypothetical protein